MQEKFLRSLRFVFNGLLSGMDDLLLPVGPWFIRGRRHLREMNLRTTGGKFRFEPVGGSLFIFDM
jgi:hypothetical protein